MSVKSVERWVLALLDILVRADIRYAELQSSCLCLVWGFFMLPGHKPIAAFYGHVLVPWVLGCWFLGCGCMQLWALSANSRKLRSIASLLVLALWTFIAIITFRLNPRVIMMPTSLSFALSAFWGMLRLEGERTGV
jgi:hypothetical protein